MKTLWVHREVDAPAEAVWALLTNLDRWPTWGPTIRHAELDGLFEVGTTGTVTTLLGVRLPFEITAHDEGVRWTWTVAGVPATDHAVEALTPDRSRVGFGVPFAAAPYLVVCRVALSRLESIATSELVAA